MIHWNECCWSSISHRAWSWCVNRRLMLLPPPQLALLSLLYHGTPPTLSRIDILSRVCVYVSLPPDLRIRNPAQHVRSLSRSPKETALLYLKQEVLWMVALQPTL